MDRTVITLLSDLGTRDASVTVARAILMSYVPDAVVVDISHSVVQYNLQQAAYLLLSAYRHFPKGTVHVVPMNVFTAGVQEMILAEKDGYYFIAPDNGVLSLAFGDDIERVMQCGQLAQPYSFAGWMERAGEAIAKLAQGTASYPVYEMKVAPKRQEPKDTSDGVECSILYIDRYENVVLDVTREQFESKIGSRPFIIETISAGNITAISNNYNDVPVNKPLCRFNNAGFLEIALNHAPAATSLGLGAYHPGNLMYRTIKIFC